MLLVDEFVDLVVCCVFGVDLLVVDFGEGLVWGFVRCW